MANVLNKTGKALPVVFLALIVTAALLLSACSPKASGAPDGTGVDPVPSSGYVDVVLYFGDDQAMEVMPEFRSVEVPSDPAQRKPEAEIAVLELIKGPQDELLSKTIPSETKLLSLEITDGVALVNFSKEFQTKHWGGSAGETMTLQSLVYTLTQIEGIDKVQVLVEGKTIDSLGGHFEWSAPFLREVRKGDVFTSEERAKELQNRVDGGKETWRTDVLEVARRESGVRGLPREADYKVVSEAQGRATVQATSGDKSYTLELVQPEKQGDSGIWVISKVK